MITVADGKIFLRFERRVTLRQTIGDKAGLAVRLDGIGLDVCSGIERPRRHLANRIEGDRFRVAPKEICGMALAGLGRLILSRVVAGLQAKAGSFGIEEN